MIVLMMVIKASSCDPEYSCLSPVGYATACARTATCVLLVVEGLLYLARAKCAHEGKRANGRCSGKGAGDRFWKWFVLL